MAAPFDNLEDFAEHVRRQAFRLSATLFRELGTSHPAALAAARLHEEAAAVLTGRQMDAEQSEIEQLDLALLPPVRPASPFDEE